MSRSFFDSFSPRLEEAIAKDAAEVEEKVEEMVEEAEEAVEEEVKDDEKDGKARGKSLKARILDQEGGGASPARASTPTRRSRRLSEDSSSLLPSLPLAPSTPGKRSSATALSQIVRELR